MFALSCLYYYASGYDPKEIGHKDNAELTSLEVDARYDQGCATMRHFVMSRKKYSTKFKSWVVLEILPGEMTTSQSAI